MKKMRFTLLLFSVFFINLQSQGQCDPVFEVKMHNLHCGIGTLCLIFDHDINQECWGEDLSLQIEYNTPEFIVIDPGEYVMDPNSNSATTWYNVDVEWLNPMFMEYCFKGVVQVPGVILTLRIIDNATGNILYEEDLEPEIQNTIGNGGTILLSSLLGNQLLDPITAATTAQRIIIDGTLIVDESYFFGTTTSGGIKQNEILLTPNSQIVVNQGKGLGFKYATISSCQSIWKGIQLLDNSRVIFDHVLIENAEKAIEAGAQTRSTIQYANFSNCNYGVYADFDFDTEYNLNIFTTSSDLGGRHRVEFTADENSLFSFHEGCHLRNVSVETHIAGWVNFIKLTIGIYAYNSDLLVGFNGGAFPGFSELNTGITSSHSDILQVQGDFDKCENYGVIFSQNDDTRIHHSNFYECENAIFFNTLNPHEHVEIDRNEIWSCNSGIGGIVRPSRGEIQFNTQIRSEYSNVNLLGLGSGSHFWATQHNDWMKSDVGYNVRYRHTNFSRIYHNDLSECDAVQNFSVRGGELNLVGCNNILTNNSGNNILLSGSPMSQLYCNASLSSTGGANILIAELNGQSDIRKNNMTSNTYNLQYGGIGNGMAISGPQHFRGNKFDVSSENNPKAIHYGDEQTASFSDYFVEYLSPKGSEDFPFFVSDNIDWFLNAFAGNAPNCGNCSSGIIGGAGEAISHQDNAEVLYMFIDGGVASTYGTEALFDAEIKLWRSLLILEEMDILSGDLLSYYNSNLGSEPYQFAYMDKQLKDAVDLSTSDYTMVVSIDNDLADKLDAYMAIEWYSFDENTGELEIDETAELEKATIWSEIEGLKLQMANITTPYKTHWLSTLTNMMSYNAGIIPQTNSGANLKTVNDVYYHIALNRETELSTLDETLISGIAEQCVRLGGEGVLIARNLMAMHLGEVTEYNDDCTQQLMAPDDGGSMETMPISVSPNPSKNTVVVSTNDGETVDAFVVDLLGRIVWNGELREGIAIIPMSTWENGVYFIQTYDNVYRGKIIVNRK